MGKVTQVFETSYEIKFLKHVDCNKFKWPDTDDIDVVDMTTIVMKLKDPVETKRNDRVTGYRFNNNFFGYSL